MHYHDNRLHFTMLPGHPSEPYVLVTATSSMSIGLEDVYDTCFRRFSPKLTSAVRLKNGGV